MTYPHHSTLLESLALVVTLTGCGGNVASAPATATNDGSVGSDAGVDAATDAPSDSTVTCPTPLVLPAGIDGYGAPFLSMMCSRGIPVTKGTCDGYVWVVGSEAQDCSLYFVFDATTLTAVATAYGCNGTVTCESAIPGFSLPTECASGSSAIADPTSPCADAGQLCVNVDPTSFSQACTVASDCVTVTTGMVCEGSCGCGNSLINKSELGAYAAATSGITFGGCPCPPPLPPACTAGQCVTSGGIH